jgi:Holliday junction resolvase
MKKKTTRDTGNSLEKKALRVLSEYGFRQTAGSGSVFKDGDLSHPQYVVECKVRNSTSGLSISGSDLVKLIKEAKKQGKEWLAILENRDGVKSVMMDLNQFATLLEELQDEG